MFSINSLRHFSTIMSLLMFIAVRASADRLQSGLVQRHIAKTKDRMNTDDDHSNVNPTNSPSYRYSVPSEIPQISLAVTKEPTVQRTNFPSDIKTMLQPTAHTPTIQSRETTMPSFMLSFLPTSVPSVDSSTLHNTTEPSTMNYEKYPSLITTESMTGAPKQVLPSSSPIMFTLSPSEFANSGGPTSANSDSFHSVIPTHIPTNESFKQPYATYPPDTSNLTNRTQYISPKISHSSNVHLPDITIILSLSHNLAKYDDFLNRILLIMNQSLEDVFLQWVGSPYTFLGLNTDIVVSGIHSNSLLRLIYEEYDANVTAVLSGKVKFLHPSVPTDEDIVAVIRNFWDIDEFWNAIKASDNELFSKIKNVTVTFSGYVYRSTGHSAGSDEGTVSDEESTRKEGIKFTLPFIVLLGAFSVLFVVAFYVLRKLTAEKDDPSTHLNQVQHNGLFSESSISSSDLHGWPVTTIRNGRVHILSPGGHTFPFSTFPASSEDKTRTWM